jgi:hypothetical protein
MRKIGANHKIHGHTECEQRRPCQKASPHTKEAAKDAYDKTNSDQIGWKNMGLRNQEVHDCALILESVVHNSRLRRSSLNKVNVSMALAERNYGPYHFNPANNHDY